MRVGYRAWLRVRSRALRAALVLRVKLKAALVAASVDLDVAPDAIVGRRVRVEIDWCSTNRFALGAGARLEDDVFIWLRGGTVEIGSQAEIRSRAAMNSSGVLRLGEGVMLGWGAALHCADQLVVDDLAVVAEYATIADSDHVRTAAGVPLLHHVRACPTSIGRGAWIGAHAVVTSGVTVGEQAFVGGGAVVTSDVPPGWLAAGNPARSLRELRVEEP
jgi:maltose O-acetyltransferase